LMAKIHHNHGIHTRSNSNLCAGCGRLLGVFSVVVTGEEEAEGVIESFPFDENDCPVCTNRKDPDAYSAENIARHADIKDIQNALMVARQNK